MAGNRSGGSATLEQGNEKTGYENNAEERMENAATDFFKDLEAREPTLSNEIKSISGLTRMDEKDALTFRPGWKDQDAPVTEWERTAHLRSGYQPSWMRREDRATAGDISESFQKATAEMDLNEAREASRNLAGTLMSPVDEQTRTLRDAPGFVREGPGGEVRNDRSLDAMMKPFQEDLAERTTWVKGVVERGLVTKSEAQVQNGMEQMRLLQEDFKTIRDGGTDLHFHDTARQAEYEARSAERGQEIMERFHEFRERQSPEAYRNGRPSCEEMLAEVDRAERDRKETDAVPGTKPGSLEHDLWNFGDENLPGDMKLLERHIEREAAEGRPREETGETWGGAQEMTLWDLRAQRAEHAAEQKAEQKAGEHQQATEETVSPGRFQRAAQRVREQQQATEEAEEAAQRVREQQQAEPAEAGNETDKHLDHDRIDIRNQERRGKRFLGNEGKNSRRPDVSTRKP